MHVVLQVHTILVDAFSLPSDHTSFDTLFDTLIDILFDMKVRLKSPERSA
jgi:hypothetical protein